MLPRLLLHLQRFAFGLHLIAHQLDKLADLEAECLLHLCIAPSGRHQIIAEHAVLLPHAVGTVLRLRVHSRRPIQFSKDHAGSPLQVQTRRGAHGDAAKVGLAVHERIHRLILLLCGFAPRDKDGLCRVQRGAVSVHHLMMVLSAVPDIEVTCTDSCECFDDNKTYLQARLEEETNPKVRKIIKKDIDFLDDIQTEMATARQFLLIGRCRNLKPEQVFNTANRIEKGGSEQGFETHRMKKAEIKRFLAVYFEASMNGDQMPDTDGEQFFDGEDSDEEEA